MLMLVSESHATTGPMPIWVACTVTWAVVPSGPILPQWVMSGSVAQRQPRSGLIVKGLCYHRGS